MSGFTMSITNSSVQVMYNAMLQKTGGDLYVGCLLYTSSLNLGEEDSGEISDYLSAEYEIDTRSGGHCAPLMHGALGTVDQGAVPVSYTHLKKLL